MEVVVMILSVPLALFAGFALDTGTADDGEDGDDGHGGSEHRAAGWPDEDVDDTAEPIV